MAVFNGLAKAKFQTLRQLAYLILCDARHNHQPKLTVCIQGVDIIVLKQNTHIGIQKFLCVLNAVQCASGETRDFFRDNKVKTVPVCIRNHAEKAIPLVCTGTGNAFIHISFYISPIRIPLNKICVILNLVFKTALLFNFIC